MPSPRHLLTMTEPRRRTLRTWLQGAIATLAVVVPTVQLLNATGVAHIDPVLAGALASFTVAATGAATWAYNALEGRGHELPLPAPPVRFEDIDDEVIRRWAAEDQAQPGPWD